MLNKKLSFLDEFELKGLWWLPDTPEKQFWGTLKYNPTEGMVLELMGNLEDTMKKSLIILGDSINGKRVTLYRCFEIYYYGHTINKSLKICLIKPHVVFIGIHFLRKQDIIFNKILINYSNLDKWADREIINIGHYNKNEYIIRYNHNVISICDDGSFQFSIEAFPEITMALRSLFNIKRKTYFSFTSLIKKPFDDFLPFIRMFRNFMTLALLCPTYPLIVLGDVANINKGKADRNHNLIEIFHADLFFGISNKIEYPAKHEMLFNFNDLKKSYVSVFKNLIRISSDMNEGFTTFFSVIYNHNMYISDKFIGLYNSFESYLGYKKHKKPNMRTDMINLLKNYTMLFNNNIDNIDNFIKNIIITRQYLIHSDQTKKTKSINEKDLYPIILKLRILFMACMLSELGFSIEDITQLLSRNVSVKRLFDTELIDWD